jgi:Protein of unknown function (DUF1499)
MRTLVKWVLAIVVGGAVVAAFTTWPLLHDVETGKTPEYPDLRVREFRATPDRVAKALESALASIGGWTLVGSGHGQSGYSLQALHTTPLVPLEQEVSIRIWREGEKTRVTVRSKSKSELPDFGQNARNIRELLAALDRELS